MRKIYIDVEGGLIQEIKDIPSDIEIIVRDYDVEGSDGDRITKDDQGRECFESTWTEMD